MLATWWVGLALGILLAVASRAGRRSPLPAERVRPIVLGVVVVTGITAGVAGATAWMLVSSGRIRLEGLYAAVLPPDRHAGFLIDVWTHRASYAAGLLGGVGAAVVAWRRRGGAATRVAAT